MPLLGAFSPSVICCANATSLVRGRHCFAGRSVCAAYSPTGSAVWRVVLRGRSKPLPYGGNRRVFRAGKGVHDVPEFMDREE